MGQNSEILSHIDGHSYFPHAGAVRALRRIVCASAASLHGFAHLALVVLLFWLAPATSLGATYNERPWWAERSSFTHGETLYAVGVASHAKSIEEGRQKAFENGKRELQNLFPSSSLEGLSITTQMTYEEPNDDGTTTVYRLLQIPSELLLMPKEQGKPQLPPTASRAPSTQSAMDVPEECKTWKPCSTCDAQPLNKMAQDMCVLNKTFDAKAKAMKEEREEADHRLAIENPKEYARRKALIAAHERVEAEKKELQRVCRMIGKGLTKNETEIITGQPVNEWQGPDGGAAASYLDGRLTLYFDKYGRLYLNPDCVLAFAK